MNNKVLVGIMAIISAAIGIFAGLGIAYSRAEAKKESAVALKDYYLFLQKDPITFGEPEKTDIKKGEKFAVLKKVYSGVSKKGKMKYDVQVTGTDNRKYLLKKDDIYEILGWSDKSMDNGFRNYYLKLAQNGDTEVSCEVNGRNFGPLRKGQWWYVKNKDGKTGWVHPIEGYVNLLSEQINFIGVNEPKSLGLDGTAYDLQTEDKEEICLRADRQGSAKLISKKDNRELLAFNNFDKIDSPVDFSVRDIYTKSPDNHLWEITAAAGAHAKNCGYWIIGKNKGKWTVYISDKELSEQGYTPEKWHRLYSKAENGRLIITSSHEYMPPGAQYGYQLKAIDDISFEAFWDYESDRLKIRPWGEME